MKLLNLPIDVKYTLIDVYDAQEVQTVCSNCFMPIRNIATIESVNGKYGVGVDCAESLCRNADTSLASMQQIKLVKREIARGGTPTLICKGTNVVVCYQADNSNLWFETVPVFKTAVTSLPAQLATQYSDAPRLTCLNDAKNYATALKEHSEVTK
jgi:uncharacterized protein YccT (UPF0319 family)